MKTRSFLQAVLATTLIAVMSSCSTAKLSSDNLAQVKNMQPPTGKAIVYIVRPGILAYIISFNVTCDGKDIGSTSAKRFIYTILDPGTHKFIGKAENKAELFLTVQAGQTYFIEQDAEMGLGSARNSLTVIDAATGRTKLARCKLSGNCPAYAPVNQGH